MDNINILKILKTVSWLVIGVTFFYVFAYPLVKTKKSDISVKITPINIDKKFFERIGRLEDNQVNIDSDSQVQENTNNIQ